MTPKNRLTTLNKDNFITYITKYGNKVDFPFMLVVKTVISSKLLSVSDKTEIRDHLRNTLKKKFKMLLVDSPSFHFILSTIGKSMSPDEVKLYLKTMSLQRTKLLKKLSNSKGSNVQRYTYHRSKDVKEVTAKLIRKARKTKLRPDAAYYSHHNFVD